MTESFTLWCTLALLTLNPAMCTLTSISSYNLDITAMLEHPFMSDTLLVTTSTRLYQLNSTTCEVMLQGQQPDGSDDQSPCVYNLVKTIPHVVLNLVYLLHVDFSMTAWLSDSFPLATSSAAVLMSDLEQNCVHALDLESMNHTVFAGECGLPVIEPLDGALQNIRINSPTTLSKHDGANNTLVLRIFGPDISITSTGNSFYRMICTLVDMGVCAYRTNSLTYTGEGSRVLGWQSDTGRKIRSNDACRIVIGNTEYVGCILSGTTMDQFFYYVNSSDGALEVVDLDQMPQDVDVLPGKRKCIMLYDQVTCDGISLLGGLKMSEILVLRGNSIHYAKSTDVRDFYPQLSTISPATTPITTQHDDTCTPPIRTHFRIEPNLGHPCSTNFLQRLTVERLESCAYVCIKNCECDFFSFDKMLALCTLHHSHHNLAADSTDNVQCYQISTD